MSEKRPWRPDATTARSLFVEYVSWAMDNGAEDEREWLEYVWEGWDEDYGAVSPRPSLPELASWFNKRVRVRAYKWCGYILALTEREAERRFK